LRVMFLVGFFDDDSTYPKGSRNTSEHQILAREIAEEGIVLLKNEGDLLPVGKEVVKKIAVIGPTANRKTSLGGGSSTNFPPYEIKPIEGLKEKCKGKIEIIESPSEADLTLIFAGYQHKKGMDMEGEDRDSFHLPLEQIELITKTLKENANTVVILVSGSPISMKEWIDKVPVVVQAWYGGMEAGNAIASILLGEVNPSGKLPLTFPKKLSDSPAHTSERTYPGDKQVFYDEGIFVGYRHFDTKDIEPLFPFGHGLSYTKFTYENLVIDNKMISENDVLRFSVDIVNSGNLVGSEVVQLYIQDVESRVERPSKELKGFRKVKLKPGEKSTVRFEVLNEDLSYFDENTNQWVAEKGEFILLIGSSSRDIRLEGKFEYRG
ncbi:hypothetical protein LCGC14_1007200, partial [marine sediment metagenome]